MHTIYSVSVYEKVNAQDSGIDKANHDLGRDEAKQDLVMDKASQDLVRDKAADHDLRRDETDSVELFIEDKNFQKQSSPFTDSATNDTVRAAILFNIADNISYL